MIRWFLERRKATLMVGGVSFCFVGEISREILGRKTIKN
jgi:hypothetical protein